MPDNHPVLPDFGDLKSDYVANCILGGYVVFLVLLGIYYGGSVVKVLAQAKTRRGEIYSLLKRFHRVVVGLTIVGIAAIATIAWQAPPSMHANVYQQIAFWYAIGTEMLLVSALLVHAVARPKQRFGDDGADVELRVVDLLPGKLRRTTSEQAVRGIRRGTLLVARWMRSVCCCWPSNVESLSFANGNDDITTLAVASAPAPPRLSDPVLPHKMRLETVSVISEDMEDVWKQESSPTTVITVERIVPKVVRTVNVREKIEEARSAPSWFYKDLENKIQGPFASTTMRSWWMGGFLPATLRVRRGDDANERFTAISDMFSGDVDSAFLC